MSIKTKRKKKHIKVSTADNESGYYHRDNKEKGLYKYAEIPYWKVPTHSREQERDKSDDFEF